MIYRRTLFIICIGYFIDFYDLTIFSASYVSLLKEQFNLINTVDIQSTYLLINNYYTAGIVIGGILFGILSDKFGRIAMIRYSILLYSFSIILSIFTHSLPIFIFLRFISGIGLSAEFATSSVLIAELLPTNLANRYTNLLYLCGVLGGMTATYMSGISWKLMFLFGGVAGLLLYILRSKIYESLLFKNLTTHINRGQLSLLFHKNNILKLINLLLLITPFYFLISIMFLYPKFMPITIDLSVAIRKILFGFFIGNIISVGFATILINKFKNYKLFLLFNMLIFVLIMPVFIFISDKYVFFYACILGLLGGGLPTVWVQLVVKSYGTNLRATATASLTAFGRMTCIIFNLLFQSWLTNPNIFIKNAIIMICLLTMIVCLVIYYTKNNYNKELNFIEN